MNDLIVMEDILRSKMEGVKEGEFLLELFKVAEEVGIGEEIELQNNFTSVALEFISEALKERSIIDLDSAYKGIRNIYYVVELYLRGFSDTSPYMGLEEFLLLVKDKDVMPIIINSKRIYELHINRLKKVIVKAKRRIPYSNNNYKETRRLLDQIDGDTRYCLNYPTTNADLSTFYFGSYHELCKPVFNVKSTGIIALEQTVYALYHELTIISKLDIECIDKLCRQYYRKIGLKLPFNLFEKVINNYLFAIPYSNNPENLQISKVDAGLLINEIKSGTLHSDELINEFISRYEFKELDIAYLKEYGKYLESRINEVKDSNSFSELFVITSSN